ncbi:putative F420-dependent oxidoreductase, MSMEG_2516 family [Streptoalloteichus tenebrarius]|uniref:F420-dependent oxidoreductase, MSMEG_2516 family n=1 Tax=Streptoalloteichus tenebrarius (strain ATCC 17920 / DSM 40477 / JCM 4838 / CBS 697.72 / NBRC 16177 / NCIMB 11028 / NRRL B-12390 / A12253. 1 / ISP 5477) TaxID=1933 RepID=A0ABT1HNH2_STRSD|nr:TIGR03621 family F420-dependent LLM class oxidoreductase [Streptoalloteichus tenebrarius]MCP2257059.1 putative F420-dependent oxidoreductase, MSMEG_2516 family [Streptoalloteichus tenebrarius]BFE98691.1 TIGR03621 family F420-dependent LLM class oxidoreductase [Streptoalloteichus tenebrarius]
MTTRPFRFGVTFFTGVSRADWQASARRAEDLGYDVVLAPDHLGMSSPFALLAAAAQVTSRVRLGTFVLNAGFHRPALLARDVASLDQLLEGRLELGLGAGYAAHEYEAAGLPFPRAGERVDHLARTVAELRRLLADEGHQPTPVQRPTPPILVAGQGDRLLRVAARQADIVGIAGALPRDEHDTGHAALADKIAAVRAAAGPRWADLELNLLVQAVLPDSEPHPDLSFLRGFAPGLSDERILALPGVLRGSPASMADTLREYRETYGLSYFTVTEPGMDAFAEVIAQLR